MWSASSRSGVMAGTVESMVVTMPGEVPQVTVGESVAASMVSSRSKVAPVSVTRALPLFDGEVPCVRRRSDGEAAAFEVGEGDGVRGDHAGAGTGFDAHVADGHAAFHGEGADGGAGIFHGIPGRAGGADAADDVEDDVLGGDAGGEVAFDVDAEGLGFVLREGLGGHDVFDFGGADAEG